MEDVKAAFKKFKGYMFMLDPEQRISWYKDDATKLPYNRIYGGPHGRPPAREFSPYEIKCVTCSKPGLFKAGVFTIIGMDNQILCQFPHSYKENCKIVDEFNSYLELYRNCKLPK